MDLLALRSELLVDPLGRGYAGMTDAQAADSLNAVDRPQERRVIPAHEIIDATTPAEWTALTAAEKQRYQTLTGAGQVNVQSANVRAAFQAMFPAGSETRAALLALVNTMISRAAELGLPAVGAHHVAHARSMA